MDEKIQQDTALKRQPPGKEDKLSLGTESLHRSQSTDTQETAHTADNPHLEGTNFSFPVKEADKEVEPHMTPDQHVPVQDPALSDAHLSAVPGVPGQQSAILDEEEEEEYTPTLLDRVVSFLAECLRKFELSLTGKTRSTGPGTAPNPSAQPAKSRVRRKKKRRTTEENPDEEQEGHLKHGSSPQ